MDITEDSRIFFNIRKYAETQYINNDIIGLSESDIINQMLNSHGAYYDRQLDALIFESEKYRNMFLLKWS